MRVSLLLIALVLAACAVPTKQQNPNVTKRPVKTSKFLGKNDYYIDEKAEKKNVAKKDKAEDKKEAAVKKPEEKTEETAKKKDVTVEKLKQEAIKEEVKIETSEDKQNSEAVVEEQMAISDYPMDRHRRRAFSGFTRTDEEMAEEKAAKGEEKTEQAEEKEEAPLYEFDQQGLASWYGPGFHGRKTANGEKFNQNAMTAAHRKYPMGTILEVTNLENGKTVTVRVNDRGPYSGKRIIDLSKAAAKELDMLHDGVGEVGIREVDE